MYRYRVWYEFKNEAGEWVEAFLDDCGEGFCEADALQIAREFKYRGHRNVRLEELTYS